MTQILMIYHIPQGNDKQRIKFNRKLFNQEIQSHQGKYKTITQGILTKYEKPIRSTVIFQETKLTQIKKICEQFKITKRFFKIQEIKD